MYAFVQKIHILHASKPPGREGAVVVRIYDADGLDDGPVSPVSFTRCLARRLLVGVGVIFCVVHTVLGTIAVDGSLTQTYIFQCVVVSR